MRQGSIESSILGLTAPLTQIGNRRLAAHHAEYYFPTFSCDRDPQRI